MVSRFGVEVSRPGLSCLAAIVRLARFGWLFAWSWLCCSGGCLLVVAPCAIVAVVVVLAGGVFPGFTPAVPEKQLEPQSVHELLCRAAVVTSSSSRSVTAALAVLAPLALGLQALLAVLTLAPPALRLFLRCHVGKLEERIVDKCHLVVRRGVLVSLVVPLVVARLAPLRLALHRVRRPVFGRRIVDGLVVLGRVPRLDPGSLRTAHRVEGPL